jgi:pyruvate/2-oxoglutarate/acetoin dehydrogenase E1 component
MSGGARITIPTGHHGVPLRCDPAGENTLVVCGRQVHETPAAAQHPQEESIDAKVIDLRSLVPLHAKV